MQLLVVPNWPKKSIIVGLSSITDYFLEAGRHYCQSLTKLYLTGLEVWKDYGLGENDFFIKVRERTSVGRK